MYRIYPVSLPFGRSGGSHDMLMVFIELITALMPAGTEGAKSSRNKQYDYLCYKFLSDDKTIIALLSSSVLQ